MENDILNYAIDEEIKKEITVTRNGKKIKAQVIALEGSLCQTFITLGAKLFAQRNASNSNMLNENISLTEQYIEVCLRYAYKEYNEETKQYEPLSEESIKHAIKKEFLFANTITEHVNLLTAKLINFEADETILSKKN